MNVRSLLRLNSIVGNVNFDKRRFYCSRNVLKLHERGMYEDIFPDTSTNEIVDLLNKSSQCVYAGFDPTADSLHIGNLLILMNLLHWQRAGHQVIALVGGATGLIGDPSHRKSERIEIERYVIEENIKSITKNIETIFNNHRYYFWKKETALKPLIIVNNLDWYTNVNVIEFIKSIGKYFRMGTMLGRSSVQARLNSETGMNFTEFTYQVFQANDWLQLMKNYKCRFQIGGSDQMGNIMSGYDLITKSMRKEVYGITLPLITAEGGKKFGKSLLNAVWLSPTKSSSFQLYQYFIRAKDSDVEKFLKLFTFIPLNNITEIVKNHMNDPEQRRAQKLLAEQVTLLVHGEDGLLAAKRASAALYEKSIESFVRLNASELIDVFEGATIVDVLSQPGITIYELAKKAKCFKTDRDAERIITAGGFYVNYQKITNLNEVIVPGIHILSNNVSLLRVGKKTYHIVRWQ
ncbi:putative tyrosyl-tRNA synthetase, mitochondrial [Trachymyrmex septentrionalis]|uniref:Tyrosine--tRNA ligase n=1 Tax=Trachymyrmex septentrionalis TaxID=34720 RepID=A0A195EQN4_9HYME|nr:PREDICTED: tyrosine--tRNA ligase, mitochondrial [Trachymyrmex septentrionalis]KYN30486.1 putative tyrosyl-tRNA synthetase, mitochondrial [Trachymyrmex septentrionalis]